ncbi:MAG: terminase small subunit protein [Proteobacteria bacterium]|nr:terminase small subunit protein [Pseudomonadota bacterium]
MRSTSSKTRTDKRKARPKPKARRRRGRPSRYTPDLAADICRRLADGEPLRSICRDPAMPDKATVLRWLADKKKADFRDQYAHARVMQADALFDEALEIADETTGDLTTDKDGKETVNHENIQRSRLRVDTRKWAAGKLAPKVYGDKIQHTGEGGGPIRTEVDLTGIPTDVLCELRKLAARI